MMADVSTTIQTIPKEVRVILFQYLNQTNIRSLRSMSKWAEDDIRYGRLFIIPTCTLTDNDTVRFVLNSKARINLLRIHDLMEPRRITVNRGGVFLNHVLDIIIGKNIGKENLKNILKYLERVRTFRFESANKSVLDNFIKFDRTYQHVGTLDLFLGIRNFEADFISSLIKQDLVMFPNLRKLNFGWKKFRLTGWGKRNWGWQVYVAVHKLVWTHRNTVKSIDWDFGQLLVGYTVKSIHCLCCGELNAFKRLMVQILDVSQLQDIKIRTLNWENMSDSLGDHVWNLSTQLLSAQTQLVNLSYKPRILTRFELAAIETMRPHISHTIEKFQVFPRLPRHSPGRFRLEHFTTYAILKELKMLQIPYRASDIIHLPRSLTSLAMTLDATFEEDMNIAMIVAPPNHNQVLASIGVHLKGLARLELILNGDVWINVVEFKTLINNLPDLVELEIIFPQFFIHHIKTLKAATVGKKGVSVKLAKDLDKTSDRREILTWEARTDTYTLKCNINRTTFKDFILD